MSGRKFSPRALLTEVLMMIGTPAVRGSLLSRAANANPASMLVIIRSVMTRSGASAEMRVCASTGLVAVTTR